MFANELLQDLIIVIVLVITTPLLALACLYGISRFAAWGIGK